MCIYLGDDVTLGAAGEATVSYMGLDKSLSGECDKYLSVKGIGI